MKRGLSLHLALLILTFASPVFADDATLSTFWPLYDYRASTQADYQSLHLEIPRLTSSIHCSGTKKIKIHHASTSFTLSTTISANAKQAATIAGTSFLFFFTAKKSRAPTWPSSHSVEPFTTGSDEIVSRSSCSLSTAVQSVAADGSTMCSGRSLPEFRVRMSRGTSSGRFTGKAVRPVSTERSFFSGRSFSQNPESLIVTTQRR